MSPCADDRGCCNALRFETAGLQDLNFGNGDKGSLGWRLAKDCCDHIAIIRAVTPNARDRPLGGERSCEQRMVASRASDI
jgi:hypothetical protein